MYLIRRQSPSAKVDLGAALTPPLRLDSHYSSRNIRQTTSLQSAATSHNASPTYNSPQLQLALSTSLHLPSSTAMAPKRGRDDDDKAGSAKVKQQMKGLSWNASHAQPAFLKNALSALQGPKPARDMGDGSGRPEIPTRPEGEEPESEEDEWDMGRGEEAPAVVVLKEGRHIDRDEVDRIRAEGV